MKTINTVYGLRHKKTGLYYTPLICIRDKKTKNITHCTNLSEKIHIYRIKSAISPYYTDENGVRLTTGESDFVYVKFELKEINE